MDKELKKSFENNPMMLQWFEEPPPNSIGILGEL
jgi:hypothetical protein